MTSAADAMGLVSRSSVEVLAAAKRSEVAAGNVHRASGDVGQATGSLRDEVTGFLTAIKRVAAG